MPVAPTYRAVIIGDGAIYIEGVKEIMCFGDDEILLRLKRGELSIKGNGLSIKKYCAEDVAVCGIITGVIRR
jgi:sporulation protein YqfC